MNNGGKGPRHGLGLSVVCNIIENHSGTISAKSEPGLDVVFTIELPIVPNHEKGEQDGQRI